MDTTAFLSEASLWTPDRLIQSAWLEHAPFAFWLIERQRPGLVVELGSHAGFSYSAFCQAIARLSLPTRAYAIDTWKGDEHAGFYGNEVFEELSRYHQARYPFSTLLRSTFDEALPQFADGSIDLLHIDGRHFYEDVSHDFESWRPKLSDSAIVLFHDTNAHENDFGVARLWAEISPGHPSFEFLHGYGLGVLATGSQVPDRLGAFFSAARNERDVAEIRAVYARLGESVREACEEAQAMRAAESDIELVNLLRSRTTGFAARALAAEKSLRASALSAKALEASVAEATAALAAKADALAHAERRLVELEVATARLEDQVAASEAQRVTAQRQLQSSRYLFRALWRKTRNAPRDWSRSIRRSLRKRRQHGPGAALDTAAHADSKSGYARWIETTDYQAGRDRKRLIKAIKALPSKPLISVVMPVYNPPAEFLEAAIASVLMQVYANWELCIADDHSTEPHVREILSRYAARDQRIKVAYQAENGNISRATNTAFALASGPWIALLDHDDILGEHALAEVALEIARHPDAEIIYSDEDKLSVGGERYEPYFKPDFSRELFRSYNYLNHLSVHRAENIRAVGGWRAGFEGSQDYDLNLRIFERIDAARIRHIPKILYHWRAVPGSTAQSPDAKSFAYDAGLRALEEHVERTRLPAVVEAGPERLGYRMRLQVPEPHPLVSLIVATRDRLALLRRCIESIREKTTYGPYEIIVIDNGSVETATLAYFREIERFENVRIIPYDQPFNFSAINNFAAKQARGEVLGLINNDIEVISPDWLSEMVSWACLPDVGCVGAKLYYPNETIQHAGVILGPGGVAGHSHKYFPRAHRGYFARLQLVQNLTAVTAACLVVRKDVYEEVGGLNETELKVAFNDVDFCLKVREAGYLNVWTPFAELYHLESATRGDDNSAEHQGRFASEIDYMRRKWRAAIVSDPYYSPHLTRDREDFSLRLDAGAR
ncbi:MAG TPA: glycosyltransferase [Bauldia sp.]|nr:glycosyltransferase [Bauldia sp.]